MDILKSLKDVNNVDEYIAVTQDVNKQSKNVKVQINITTVLTLKKIRSFEIEYQNKCDENGIACIILERLLALPPSKAWESLGKELICLLQYWLEAIRKHLLNHSHRWWTFLKQLLIFIKDIRPKSPSIPDLLAEHLTECLLDIATSELPDPFQRHEILHALNVYCAESSRDIRFAMRNKFADYFVKLSSQMATSGYLPHQYNVLECLMRWLVPRKERLLRAASAEKWFKPDLYPNEAVQIFKQANWNNFFQDARDFLNALNTANGLVSSVVVRRLCVGDTAIITGSEKQESWLDLNSVGPCVSVLLDPRALHTFGVRDFCAAFTLCVTECDTVTVNLYSESGIYLSITTDSPPSIRPSDIILGQEKTITVSISSRNDLRKMDVALRRVFGDKYQLQFDLNSQISLSPPRSFHNRKLETNSEDDTRFSHPVEVPKKRHCGYAVRSRLPKAVNTPSSASGSSIAHLYNKLATLPPHNFDKEWVSVCAKPALSHVSELTERDDRSTVTTLKYKPYGVAQRNKLYMETPKPRSDSESKPYRKETIKSQSDTEATKTRRPKRTLSPVASDNEVSILLATTIGSTDDTVINETVERISKKEGFNRSNIVDLLIQEALQEKEKATDSGINTDDNKKSQDTEENSEAIEGTPVLANEKVKKSKPEVKKKVCTVISKSTTDDESNAEVVNETPTFVTLRNRAKDNAKPNESSFDFNKVENFFSEHFTANKESEAIISPTLARKVNMTSSESSYALDDCLIMDENFNPDEQIFQFNEIDIIECLNDVVDKVCLELDGSSKYVREKIADKICPVTPKKSTKSPVVGKSKTAKTEEKCKQKRTIKIKFKTASENNNSKRVLATKMKKAQKNMSTIAEQTDDENLFVENEVSKVQTPEVIQKAKIVGESTPLERRKRKLFSPKDNEIEIEKISKAPTSDTDENELLSNLKIKNTTPKATVSCYKEIENERKKHVRPKPRISKGKVKEPSSPRTLKMNETFDKLKDNVEGSENIVLVDKTNVQLQVYNFSSESEEEAFKKKTINIRKKTRSTAVTSTISKASNRRGRKKTPVSYSDWISSDDEAKKLPAKRKPPAKRTNKQKAFTVEHVVDLIDEKMRDATDTMNDSFIVENKPRNKETQNIELKLKYLPEMELISDTEEPKKVKSLKTLPKKTNRKTEKVSIKKENKKVDLKQVSNKEDNVSVASSSPLPGLVVEQIPSRRDDANDSITAKMAQKFKRIYQDGPDQNESNITQNMLSDIERNNSQQNVILSVTDEIRAEYDLIQVVKESNKPIKTKDKNEFKKAGTVKEYDNEILEIPEQSNKFLYIRKPTKTKVNDVPKKTGPLKELSEEIMDISEYKTSRNSPMSIASDGINAHNDLEAEPPSPDTIKENFRPREIEDLDPSMRQFYEKLTKEINKSHDDSKEKSTSEVQNTSVDKSPVVVVQRLSIDDISKYLPSPKSSTISSKRTPVVSLQRMSSGDIEKHQSQRSSISVTEKSLIGKRKPDTGKYLPSLKSSTSQSDNSIVKSKDRSEKAKSPVIKVGRISLEEFNKWLPPIDEITQRANNNDFDPDSEPPFSQRSSQNKLNSDYKPRNNKLIFKSNKSLNSNEKSTKILRKQISNTSEEDEEEPIRTRSYMRKINASKTNRTGDVIDKRNSNAPRKSNIISPVKCFKEFVTNLHPIDDSDGVQIDKSQAPKLTDYKITEEAQSNADSDDLIQTRSFAKRKAIRKIDKTQPSKLAKPKTTEDSQSNDSNDQIMKTRTFAKPKAPKLKDPEPEISSRSIKRAFSPIRVSERDNKKTKVTISEDIPSDKSKDDVVPISESGPSVQSVQDWFKRTETRPKGNIYEQFEDIIKHVLEKLNTTLAEVNHNTNKQFINLFVEVQLQLAHLQDERNRTYDQAKRTYDEAILKYDEAKRTYDEAKRTYDEAIMKCNEANRNSQEMDAKFMEYLKQRAFELLKKDCKQKRAMVALLKDDVRAVLEQIEKLKSTE